MDYVIQISQFVLSLSILIILHELGHFLPAKWFGVRVDKFYLFFDAGFSLFKKKIGETEYGVGWLPLGGYVKLNGMVDESMDLEHLQQEPQPHEFRSKPAWQRLIIMVGGVTVNVLLAFVIYAGMLAYWGEEYLPNKNATYGIMVDSTAEAMGLRNGDHVVSINNKPVDNFMSIPLEILLGESGSIRVLRNGEEVDITYNASQIGDLIKSKSQLVTPRFPYVAGEFTDSSSAAAAGMQVGDSVVALNGEPLRFFDEYLEALPKYKGDTVQLTVRNTSGTRELAVAVPTSGKVGVYPVNPLMFLETEQKEYGFFEAIPAGVAKSVKVFGDYIRQFKLILNPETGAYKEVGGFIMIANQFDSVWNWQKFWSFTAFLSIMLAFLNILPIPALDGGHVVFTLWEMITGKPAPQKVLEYAQIAGFVILLGLILVVNGNDVLKLFR